MAILLYEESLASRFGQWHTHTHTHRFIVFSVSCVQGTLCLVWSQLPTLRMATLVPTLARRYVDCWPLAVTTKVLSSSPPPLVWPAHATATCSGAAVLQVSHSRPTGTGTRGVTGVTIKTRLYINKEWNMMVEFKKW